MNATSSWLAKSRPGRRPVARAMLSSALLALPLMWSPPVHSHVGPAVDANNRYVRITPMKDRVRLAYTVFLGELPGARARQRIDRNRDGTVSDEESMVYGRELAAKVAPNLDITADGIAHPVAWSELHVGMGMPTTNAGSFAVDMVSWLCVGDKPAHTLVIFDRYEVPKPGETEVKVQTSPGVAIGRSSLGDERRGSQLELQWRGAGGPMTTMGLHIEYTVDPELAEKPPGDHCRRETASPEEKEPRNWLALLGFLVLAVIALAGFVAVRMRRGTQKTNG